MKKKNDGAKSANSANSASGILILGSNGINYFRVYSKDKTFVDHRLVHTDLQVEIKDTDAFFYTNKIGERLLDHSPKTLGMHYNVDLVLKMTGR